MMKDAVSTSSVEVAETHKEKLEEVAEAVKVNVNRGHVVEFNANGCNESSQPVKKVRVRLHREVCGQQPHTRLPPRFV